MSIQGDVNELKGLEHEIKSLAKRLKMLRQRKRSVEANIAAYLHAKETPGVKHQGTAIIVEEKTKRASKSNKQRDRDAIYVLESHGIRHPERVLRELMEARKGEEIPADKIKMKKYKDNRF